jgi:hypothetical protein
MTEVALTWKITSLHNLKILTDFIFLPPLNKRLARLFMRYSQSHCKIVVELNVHVNGNANANAKQS